MAAIRFYFDKRRETKDSKYPLKISVTHQKKYTLINTGVYLTSAQWDEKKEKVTNHPNKAYLNDYLNKYLADIQANLYKLKDSGKLASLSSKQIKSRILNQENNQVLFVEHFRAFAESKSNPRTKEVYQYTLNKISLFAKSEIYNLTFEDINYNWLKDFEKFLEKTSTTNSISIHLRNIRAVFNDALNRELTTAYPFRKFKIKNEKTAKRSLSLQNIVCLRDYEVEDHQKSYRDIFMLIFYLRGINTIDLCHLTHKSLINGRIEYYRAKTRKFYSIKVEPEAAEIIERYKGKNYLLDILDRYKNYKDYCHRLNENLQQIGFVKIKGRGGKKIRTPLFPQITTYWARHTWATIAASLDIPKETIAAGLGHGGNSVTDIYIDFDMRKVDEANRKILDYLKL